jgi:putative membrane protein
MRPLVAHCHLGLGKLSRCTGKREQAQEHFTTATTMYREMGMTTGWSRRRRRWEGRPDGECGGVMFFLLSLIINAVALLITAWVIPGIHLGAAGPHPTTNDWVTLLIVALIFGLVNAVIRPILILLSLPLEIITLGLFTFVINAFMLLLTSWIAQGMGLGFRVDKFLSALLGALIISIVSFVLSRALTRSLSTSV